MGRRAEERMERFIGGLLRAGVLLSAGLVLAGAVLYVAQHGGDRPDYGTFHGQSLPLLSVLENAWATAVPDGRGLVQLGLLVLVATPIGRVIFSAFAFAAQGDKKYVLITLIVLAALGVSFFQIGG